MRQENGTLSVIYQMEIMMQEIYKKTIYNTEVLKSSFRNYNDAHMLIRGNITIIGHQVTKQAFKNCAPFTKCFTKIAGTTIDDAEDLDLVMPMQSLIVYS